MDLSSSASVLAEATGLQVISPGDVCREHVQLRTLLGEQMNRYMQAGHLVPDELSTKAIADALADVDGDWLLCNYPRRIGQAELLAQSGHVPDMVIELVLTEDEFVFMARRRVERQIEADPRRAERRQKLLFLYSNGQDHYQKRVRLRLMRYTVASLDRDTLLSAGGVDHDGAAVPRCSGRSGQVPVESSRLRPPYADRRRTPYRWKPLRSPNHPW